MDAGEASIRKILEGSKQFLVPHFQRPYAWQEREWKTLWDDVVEQTEDAGAAPHFIGPIVSSPARSVPEGVEKRLLIDGQQRLTTVVVLLTVLRDRSRRAGHDKIAERIQDLITNRHEDGLDRFKVLPTQGETVEESDRAALAALIDAEETPSQSRVLDAYRFFEKRLRLATKVAPDQLFNALTQRVTLVSIKLGQDDNPYRIFESLNGKGRPLTQGDLIRNYFFMQIPREDHERVYSDVWKPMQRRLGEDRLTDFIRHDLTAASGQVIRETDVYASLKARVEEGGEPVAHLKRLSKASVHYQALLEPATVASPAIRTRLERIRRLEVTVAYPLLLPAYAAFERGELPQGELIRLLDAIETYVLRRFVCGIPTYGLNKIFAPLFAQNVPTDTGFVDRVLRTLSKRDCPRDTTFRERLQTERLYGGGERREKLKLLLEKLEALAGHKEAIDPRPLTIEHVMPQTLTSEWYSQLGDDAAEVHDELLHTLGNLSLTGYNSELGNLPYVTKRQRYADSHVELNSWFANVERWTRDEIERRAAALADDALRVWPWFGAAEDATDSPESDDSVTGTVPRTFIFRGATLTVRSWADVAKVAAAQIVELGEEAFDRVSAELPKFLNHDATAFRKSSKLARLANGAYVETNHSAASMFRLVRHALRTAGVSDSDWSVAYTEGEADDDGPDELREIDGLRLEFWKEMRVALVNTGVFPTIRNAAAQMWFDIAMGKAGVHQSLIVSFREKRVGAKIVINSPRVSIALPRFTEQRGAIEKELGFALEWDPYPEKQVRTLVVWRSFDLDEKQNWPAAVQTLTELAVAMYKVFAPRVAALGG